MYRTCQSQLISMKNLILISIFISVFSNLISCQNKSNDSSSLPLNNLATPTPTATPASYPNCNVNVKATENCIGTLNSSYSYGNEYGGRSPLCDKDVNSCYPTFKTNNDGQTRLQIPSAYYSSSSVTVYDHNLVSTNIANNVAILGVVGSLTGVGYNTCIASNIDVNSKVTTDCTLSTALSVTKGTFNYDSPYGGRNTVCALDSTGMFNGPCWLQLPPTPAPRPQYLWKELVDFSKCYSPGKLDSSYKTTTSCILDPADPQNTMNYWYSSSFGGRGLNCLLRNANTQSCWIDGTGYTAQTVTSCSLPPDNTSSTNSTSSCIVNTAGLYGYNYPYGGHGNDCTAGSNVGQCFVNGTLKSTLETQLVAANIRAPSVGGNTIFGITGTYTGATFTWGSGAQRDRTVTTNVLSYSTEQTIAAPSPLPTGYYSVPHVKPNSDVDAQFPDLVAAPASTPIAAPVDRTGWNNTTCGTSGSITARITNCNTTFSGLGSTAVWQGTTRGHAGQGIWKLVTRTSCNGNNCVEVWQDVSTGLMWSSLVTTSSGANWCQASGNSNSSAVSNLNLVEQDPTGICTDPTYQNTTTNPMSACYENSQFTNTFNGINSTYPGKGGLTTALAWNAGKVFWRLPTIYDYILANHNGLRFVLPDIANSEKEWTATTYSSSRNKAWTYSIHYGFRSTVLKILPLQVRCIGR